jgi:predicted Ser/Thr protein kinase
MTATILPQMPPTPANDIAGFAEALDGQFAIERELGRGGMGVVFLARDVLLDRLVAVKVLPPELSSQTDIRERFLREARTAAQLSHPNIVPIFRADERGGFAYFAMAFVDGESLAERVRDRGALSPADAVRWLREVAWALAYAHARGVIHRDVKPENIMLERGSNRALVTDFGIARREANPGITSEGMVMGTAYYMSPEQAMAGAIDGRSDLYALGVVGFYLLSGRLPFEGPQASAILVAHVTQPAPTLRSVAPNVPSAIAAVIDRCLAKNPDDRFANGEALADALTKALEAAATVPDVTGAGSDVVLSEEQASVVWRRAAQLQAEAASRLERQPRVVTRAEESATGLPTSGYRASQVENAAVEAGISQRFVALALAELPQVKGLAAPELRGGSNRAVTAILGETRRGLSVSRLIRKSPREVLGAIGRSLSEGATGLILRDTIGGHPLDGGVLVYDLPPTAQAASGPFVQTRWGIFAKELRITLRPSANDPRSCEVTIHVDLRAGQRAAAGGYGAMSFSFGCVGAVIGAAIGKKAMLLAGAALWGTAGVGIALGIGAGVLFTRVLYAYSLGAAEKELQKVLSTLDLSTRADEIFGDAPRLAAPRDREPNGV